MDPTKLLQHFETLAETPEAVEKLRAFVLDLAVRGSLVPQNPKDAPAIQLVERAKSVLAKNRRKSDDQSNGETAVPPFSLPKNWCWTCLDELGDTAPKNELNDKTEVGFSPMRLVNAKFGEPISFEHKAWSEVRKGFTHFADGDVVVAKITPCFQNGKSGVIRGAPNGFGAGTTELHILRPVANCVLPDYALAFVKSPHFLINGEAHMTGTAGQKRVSWDYFARTPFPLPPLAEQRRIVAKVEELLALCDALEARQTAAREHRARLVRSALDHLTTAKDEPEFRQHAAFVLQHSDLVLDSAESLRQGILQLAVQGRLVEQNPKDEPASKLLVDIAAEKRRFFDERNSGKAKLQQYDPVDISDSTRAPKGWVWTSLGHVSLRIHYGYTASADHISRDVRLLRITDIQDNRVDWDSVPGCAIDETDVAKYRLAAGDILIARTGGTIGKTFLVESDPPKAVFASYLIRVIPSKLASVRFLKLFLESPLYWKQLRAKSAGTGQPNVNGEALSGLALALPPLAEQQRIVAKVDELLRWCDALEARLTAAQTTATHLLDATLHQILTA